MDLSADRPLDVVEAIRKVNALSLPNSRPPKIKPRLSASHTSGTIVLRASQAAIGYPGNELFTVSGLELRRGECAALIGPNGSGKTTFLKALLGQIEPLSGSIQLGASLKIGYFAQAQDFIDPEATVLEELSRHKAMLPEAGRATLAQYLFRGEDVFKPVGRLSGGERARLALAILALDGANFLLLDEPTNHLDIPAREALQEVLENFSGTILLVSHDRYLIDRLSTQVWDLRGGRLEIFPGSYREFILRGAAGSRAAAGAATAARQVLLAPKPVLRGDGREERRKIQAIEQLEERIRGQEAAVQRLSSQLQKTKDFERAHQISWQIAKAQAALDTLIADWERIAS